MVGDEEIHFQTAIVATGSKPRIPDLEGLEDVSFWVSKGALEADELPEHLMVLGGRCHRVRDGSLL